MSLRSVAIGLLVVGAIGIVIGVVKLVGAADDPEPRTASLPLAKVLAAATPASKPFRGLTELPLGIGGRCLRVVVADSLQERIDGLRGRSDLGGYDAMLFVFEVPTRVRFTMSGVPVPLEIGFYSSEGARTSGERMKPCPKAEAQCPTYPAAGPFVYAVETLKGQLPPGALTGCGST